MSDIEKTLKERGNRYGSFVDHAKIAQALQDTMRGSEGWGALAADQKQALTVIADKIARMLNGQPNYRDNWHDIVGYAKLVDDRLADEGGWIESRGVDQSPSAEYEVKFRDGTVHDWTELGRLSWPHTGGQKDIMFWRLKIG